MSIKKGWIGYMPPLDELQSPISKYASQVFSADGTLLGTWSRNENRIFADYDSIPFTFRFRSAFAKFCAISIDEFYDVDRCQCLSRFSSDCTSDSGDGFNKCHFIISLAR